MIHSGKSAVFQPLETFNPVFPIVGKTYEGTFTNAPDGMQLRALMGEVAVHRNWSNTRDTTTYVTDACVMLIANGLFAERNAA